jgi:aconitate hydratase
LKLAEFTLSRKDPGYVSRAKAVQELENERLRLLAGEAAGDALDRLMDALSPLWHEEKPAPEMFKKFIRKTGLASVVVAVKPGDGSAREQAASCQKVLGGQANIAVEYATKRYRSNLVNWGMIPFTIEKDELMGLAVDDFIHIPGIREAVRGGAESVPAFVISRGIRTPLTLKFKGLLQEDREIILAGCLMNHYAVQTGR